MDDLMQRVERLERANRWWKLVALGAGTALLLLVFVVAGLGLASSRRAMAERERAMAEAQEARNEAVQARQEAERQRMRAVGDAGKAAQGEGKPGKEKNP